MLVVYVQGSRRPTTPPLPDQPRSVKKAKANTFLAVFKCPSPQTRTPAIARSFFTQHNDAGRPPFYRPAPGGGGVCGPLTIYYPTIPSNGRASVAAAPGEPLATPDLTGAVVNWKLWLGKGQAPDPHNDERRP